MLPFSDNNANTRLPPISAILDFSRSVKEDASIWTLAGPSKAQRTVRDAQRPYPVEMENIPPLPPIMTSEPEVKAPVQKNQLGHRIYKFSIDDLESLAQAVRDVKPWSAKHGEAESKWGDVLQRLQDGGKFINSSTTVLRNKMDQLIAWFEQPDCSKAKTVARTLGTSPANSTSSVIHEVLQEIANDRKSAARKLVGLKRKRDSVDSTSTMSEIDHLEFSPSIQPRTSESLAPQDAKRSRMSSHATIAEPPHNTPSLVAQLQPFLAQQDMTRIPSDLLRKLETEAPRRRAIDAEGNTVKEGLSTRELLLWYITQSQQLNTALMDRTSQSSMLLHQTNMMILLQMALLLQKDEEFDEPYQLDDDVSD